MSQNSRKRWSRDIANYDIPHLRLKQVGLIISRINPSKYVDLGCGKGTLRTLTPGIKYIGCDFIQQDFTPFKFYKCDFNEEELPKELIDIELFACSGILEYIEDIPFFLKQINNRLKVNGKLILTYFNMNHISRIIDLMKGSSFHVHPDWRGFYSCKALQSTLIKSGYQIKSVFPTSHSIGTSKSVNDTLKEEVQLHTFRFYSYMFAHQYIFVCEKKTNL